MLLQPLLPKLLDRLYTRALGVATNTRRPMAVSGRKGNDAHGVQTSESVAKGLLAYI